MHSVQGGYTAKALSYAEKAMHFMPVDDSKGMLVTNFCGCDDPLPLYR